MSTPTLTQHPIGTAPVVQFKLPYLSRVLGITDDGFALVEETQSPNDPTITQLVIPITLLVVQVGTSIPRGAGPGYIGYFRAGGAVYAVFRQAV
jgi:hypothetical protein